MSVLLIVIVVAVVIGLVGGTHWYLWRRLVRDTTAPGSRARRIGTAVAVLLPLTSVGNQAMVRLGGPFTVQQVTAWPGYLWLALLLYLALALLAGEIVRAVWLRLPARTKDTATDAVRESADRTTAEPPSLVRTAVGAGSASPSPAAHDDGMPEAPETPPQSHPGRTGDRTEPTRRLFVARSVAAGATAVAATTVGYGLTSVLSGPELKRVTVPLAKLPRAAHGFRIAVVGDIHLGPVLGRAHTQRVVDTVNRANPDLIAIVGDLADGSVADLGRAAEPLRELRARHGSFFVTGNHEYFSGAEQWVDFVRELGVHPLENARTELPAFDLAGVNDRTGEDYDSGPDYDRALADRDPSRATILLAHQPVMVHDAVRHGVDLQLSGHSHGGQMWPGNYVAALANPTVAGLDRYGDTQLYVTRGAGAWGPPVRVGAPPDVTVIELASRQA